MSERTILQFTAASGWFARFLEPETGDELVVQLAGWAVVQDGTSQTVVGMIAEEKVKFCDQEANFQGYIALQDMMADAMDELDWVDEDEDDFEEDEDSDDFPPPPPPPAPPSKRKGGGRLN